jgi:hypothetical protein
MRDKIMAKLSKIAQKIHVIMCDDVRRELGNKISLMGVYGGGIVLNKVPNNLKSLVFVLVLENLITKFNKISITLKLPQDKPNELSIDAPKKVDLKMNMNLAFGFSPVKVVNTGKAKVEFRFDNDEKPRIVYNFNIKTVD